MYNSLFIIYFLRSFFYSVACKANTSIQFAKKRYSPNLCNLISMLSLSLPHSLSLSLSSDRDVPNTILFVLAMGNWWVHVLRFSCIVECSNTFISIEFLWCDSNCNLVVADWWFELLLLLQLLLNMQKCISRFVKYCVFLINRKFKHVHPMITKQ